MMTVKHSVSTTAAALVGFAELICGCGKSKERCDVDAIYHRRSEV